MAVLKSTIVLFVIGLFIGSKNNCCFSQKIPISKWREIMNMTKEEFLYEVVPGENMTMDEVSARLFPDGPEKVNDEGIGVVSAMISDAGRCETRLTGVALSADSNPSVYKLPHCVDVYRCSHCCANNLFECAPTLSNDRYFRVMKFSYDHVNDQIIWIGSDTEKIREDVECECMCKVREEHCDDAMHYYDDENCRCRCKNEHMAEHCGSTNKRWDESRCDCVCRNVFECPDGYRYDEVLCDCVVVESELESLEAGDIASPCGAVGCRAGYSLAFNNNVCWCSPSKNWGPIVVESARLADDGYILATVESETTEAMETTTTTPVPTTTTRRVRPRPNRGRGGRARPRGRK